MVSPSLVDSSTGSSNRVRLWTNHGLTTRNAAADATTTMPRRARSERSRRNSASGSTMKGSSSASSARVRIARPHAPPSHAAFPHDGRSQSRYASRIASATASAASVSAITSPSFIQRFGYSAAIAAATSPARSPATRRPTRPISATTPAPKAAIVNRCASTCSPPASNRSATHEVGARAIGASGGCCAVSDPSRGSVNHSPRASWLACTL